jgi:hypothetical protein
MSNTPVRETLPESNGRHRPRRLRGPAAAVTAGIAATSLLVAGYAVSTTAATPDVSGLTAAISRVDPELATDTVAGRGAQAGAEARAAHAEAQALREQQALDSLSASASLTRTGVDAVRGSDDEIARRKAEAAAAERAAEEAAAAEAAQAAAERAAADRAAEEAAAAEAAAEAAADRAAAAQASRSAARESAPAPAPAPAPVASGDSRSIARSMLASYGWGGDQWGCLDSLWQRESGWNHLAMNASSGAYGIPQSLPGNKMATAGADWQTNPVTQITWGLTYIQGRYGSPCNAWAHSEANNWY